MNRLFLLSACAVLTAVTAYAQPSKVTIPVSKTPANNGHEMYVSYCAPCHGLDGRGDGPTAAALVHPPADLTQLSKNNNGVYPATHVVAVLRFGIENAAHGSKLMPVWGPTLGRINHSQGSQSERSLRVANLVSYIETLQAK